jgi:hypothetical protein
LCELCELSNRFGSTEAITSEEEPANEQGKAARHNNTRHKNRNKLKRKQGILGERLMDLQRFTKSEYLLLNNDIVSNFALSVEKIFWSASTLAFNLLVNN